MADSEDKDRDLREINKEIVQAMQHWKMTAAQKESEKLQLMRENNDLRYQISALQSAQLSRTRKLNVEVQAASEEVLSHLVKASEVVARMLELTKLNMQDRIEPKLPRWSSLSTPPTADKVNRVPPLLIGGRHIQPVVSLSRTLQPNNSGSINRTNPNQNNGNEPARAIPMHMLQDVFIPLTRIDAERSVSNGEANEEENMEEDSTESLPSDSEQLEESPSAQEDFEDPSRPLEPVPEEEEEVQTRHDDSSRSLENPLEGPSWLLDASSLNPMRKHQNPKRSLTNSTSESHENEPSPGPSRRKIQMEPAPVSVTVACEFTPTVRRRRRAAPPASPPASPHRSPQPARRASNNGRILKVMVAKMRLFDDEDDSDDELPPKKSKHTEKPAKRSNQNDMGQRPNDTEVPPKRPNLDEMQPKPQKVHRRSFPNTPKRRESTPTKRHSTDGSPLCHRDLNPSQRLMRFDAPSPKGSTDARVIVLESRNDEPEPCCSGVARSRTLSRDSSGEIHSNHSHSNHSNHNSNHDNNLANRHNHSNEDNRRHKNRDTPTSQLSDNNNSNHNRSNHSNHKCNHDNNLANRHNHSNETNCRQKNNRDSPTSQLSDSSNSDHSNHNRSNHSNHNSNHDNNLGNRLNHSNEANRRQKNHDIPTNQLSDNSNSDHSNNNHSINDQRDHTTNMTESNHGNHSSVNSNSRLKKNGNGSRNNIGIDSDSSSNSDLISEGRTRRPRKAVIYKEKPLNRKLRR